MPNEAKFTKVPWVVDRALAVWGTVNGEKTLIAKAATMPCINGHNDLAAERGFDMEQANAALIAAAPDLFAALKNVVRYFDAPGDSAFSDAELEQCRAALSRARGEA